MCLRYEMEYASPLMLLAVVGVLALERALAGQPAWCRAARCGWGLLLGFSAAFNLLAGFELQEHTHLTSGDALLQAGRLEEAIAQYEKGLEIAPDDGPLRRHLGSAFAQHGEMEKAILNYRKALEIEPDLAVVRYNLGNALAQKGELEEAIAEYQKALKINPDYAEARYNLGNALFGKGDLEQAIAQYQGALEINPQYVEAHFNLGNAFLDSGRFDEAAAHYKKVLELRPGHSGALNNLGAAYTRLGRVAEAMAAYRQALALQPENVDALNNLAWALATAPQVALRDGAAALATAKKAVQLTGEGNPLMLRTLAAAYAETGSYGLAAVTARRALELAKQQKNDALDAALQTEIQIYEADNPARDGPTEGSAPTGRKAPQ
jgi:tetratricopeptide (TPR) repeat protein